MKNATTKLQELRRMHTELLSAASVTQNENIKSSFLLKASKYEKAIADIEAGKEVVFKSIICADEDERQQLKRLFDAFDEAEANGF